MKNILTYYLSILLPFPLLIWSLYYDSIMFLILLMCYVIIYRGFVDGQRLIEKKLINKNELWKAFIPFWTSKYFRQLYFEN